MDNKADKIKEILWGLDSKYPEWLPDASEIIDKATAQILAVFAIKPKWRLRKCKHANKVEVYRDYQDAYIKYFCLGCGTTFYEDLYND